MSFLTWQHKRQELVIVQSSALNLSNQEEQQKLQHDFATYKFDQYKHERL